MLISPVHTTTWGEFLARVPYPVDWTPTNAAVLSGLDAHGRVVFFGHFRPSPVDGTITATVPPHASALVKSYFLIGLVDDETGFDGLASVAEAWRQLSDSGYKLKDVLLVSGRRASPPECRTGACGHHDHICVFGNSTVPDVLTHGMSSLDSETVVVGELEPVERGRRDAAEQACRAVAAAIHSNDLTFAQLIDHATNVLQAHGKAPEPVLSGVDNLAALAVTSRQFDLVDVACRLIDADGAASARRHLSLWLRIVRHLPGDHSPGASAICAYAAWRAGDSVLAVEAIRRCPNRRHPFIGYMTSVLRSAASPLTEPPYA